MNHLRRAVRYLWSLPPGAGAEEQRIAVIGTVSITAALAFLLAAYR